MKKAPTKKELKRAAVERRKRRNGHLWDIDRVGSPKKLATHQRRAEVQREKGSQSSRQRCPLCKQLRRRWFDANSCWGGRAMWERIEEGKSKVCHICVARHKGLPLPGAYTGKIKKKKLPREQPPLAQY